MLRSALVRAVAVAAVLLAMVAFGAARAEEGPRTGRYKVYLVQLTTASYVYDLILLDGGRYEVREFDNSLKSQGEYRYEPAEQRVRWLSGLNYDMGRGGTFSVKESGAHYILMGSKVYAINGE
ncbi:hypothetical protein D3874_03955 [Oleomonas cavernae]|uniref:Uncharacterized protein n=1 Tax=Oleomonas cavernae TaxID=2320859 RepID=A0A418W8H0_9PROT|nr:hypothetical protein [Oleomonas cavernae]RJF86289.1 hypothetical protein D3874_03955 [Oleomonas cavernae]